MDDLQCPACRLVLYRRGAGAVAPRHCPRCIARSRRLVPLVALDEMQAAPKPSSSARAGEQR